MTSSMLRLGLVDYFDSIIREIDFYNESRAHKNEAEAKKFNERRDEQISFLRSSQAAYLLKIDSLNLESKLDESQDILRLVLDQTFFTFKYKEFMFVIQLNRYLDPRSLRWFKSVLRWNEHTYSSNKMSSVVDCEDIGDLKIFYYKIGLDAQCEKAWKSLVKCADSAVVDMSWLLDHCLLIQTPNSTSLARIKVKSICLVQKIESSENVDSLFDTCSMILKSSPQIDSFRVVLQVESVFNEWPKAKSIAETYPDIEFGVTLNNEIKSSIDQLSEMSWVKFIKLNVILRQTVSFNVNAQKIVELNLSCYGMKSIESNEFVNLVSLEQLTLGFNDFGHDDFDWSFLDPVKATLKRFSIDSNGLRHMPGSVFHHMVNLEALGIYEPQVEFKDFDRMFRDMASLKSLSMYTYPKLFTSPEIFNDLISLETIKLSNYQSTAQSGLEYLDQMVTSYKLPNLTRLNIVRSSYKINNASKAIFKCLIASSPRLEDLEISLVQSDMPSIYLHNEIESLKHLNLHLNQPDLFLDSRLLFKLDNLVELDIYVSASTSISSITDFSHLVALEWLKLYSNNPDFYVDCNTVITQPPILKRAEFVRCCQCIESNQDFVYIEPADKFVCKKCEI